MTYLVAQLHEERGNELKKTLGEKRDTWEGGRVNLSRLDWTGKCRTASEKYHQANGRGDHVRKVCESDTNLAAAGRVRDRGGAR